MSIRRLAFALVALSFLAQQSAAAQLMCSPALNFTPATPGVQTLTVSDIHGANVTCKYAGINTGTQTVPNFLMVVPASGTTPASVQVALNPNVTALLAPSGIYNLGIQFTAAAPANSICEVPVILHMPDEPPPAIQSVVNSASLQPILSPGALVSILGSHLTGPTLTTTFDDTALYPTSVDTTSVTFNGVAAPLLYVSPSQINAIVPFSLAVQANVQVVVQTFQRGSTPVTVSLQDTAPAIFTSSQTGAGQATVVQQDPNSSTSYNSASNPAHAGDYLEIFATGQGTWTPPAQSDVVVFSGRLPTTQASVSLTIGGQVARIVYAGPLGGLSIWCMLQINTIVPSGLAPGAQPIVLTIGANNNSQQNVFVYVQ